MRHQHAKTLACKKAISLPSALTDVSNAHDGVAGAAGPVFFFFLFLFWSRTKMTPCYFASSGQKMPWHLMFMPWKNGRWSWDFIDCSELLPCSLCAQFLLAKPLRPNGFFRLPLGGLEALWFKQQSNKRPLKSFNTPLWESVLLPQPVCSTALRKSIWKSQCLGPMMILLLLFFFFMRQHKRQSFTTSNHLQLQYSTARVRS